MFFIYFPVILVMIILSLGTNIGDREKNLNEALSRISAFAKITRQSSMIETEPWGFNSSNSFLNMVIVIETSLSPLELLEATQKVEREMGRTEKSANGVYHDRIIDIDIIDYDKIKMDTPRLILPHPRAHLRDFVMIPLKELNLENELEIVVE